MTGFRRCFVPAPSKMIFWRISIQFSYPRLFFRKIFVPIPLTKNTNGHWISCCEISNIPKPHTQPEMTHRKSPWVDLDNPDQHSFDIVTSCLHLPSISRRVWMSFVWTATSSNPTLGQFSNSASRNRTGIVDYKRPIVKCTFFILAQKYIELSVTFKSSHRSKISRKFANVVRLPNQKQNPFPCEKGKTNTL